MLVDAATRTVVVWSARVAFGLELTVFPNGSGDTTYNWVQLALCVAFAAVGAVVWSAIDRRRASYPWLKDGLWIAMRFTLALAMLGYGVNKIFGLQFPAPSMMRLVQEYGDSSPMGLTWTFMGASPAYVRFAGWMETVGGLLLLFRRTQLLGALWVAGVMTNVFVLNMCYDIPVKIYSFLLLLTAGALAAPDLARLARVFVLNRTAEPADLAGPWTNRTARRVALGVKWAWIALVVPLTFWQHWDMQSVYGDAAPRGALDGAWEVVEFRRDGAEIPPLLTDETRWRMLMISDQLDWKAAVLRKMKGVNERWRLVFLDESGAPGASGERGRLELREMTVAAGEDPSAARVVATLDYEREGDDRLRLSGEFAGARLEARLERMRPGDTLLMNRGFHWVNETPFNR
jgi:hypothetical protein